MGLVQGRGGLGRAGCCQVSLTLGSSGSSAQHISVLWTCQEPSLAFGPWQEQAHRLTLPEQVCVGTPPDCVACVSPLRAYLDGGRGEFPVAPSTQKRRLRPYYLPRVT